MGGEDLNLLKEIIKLNEEAFCFDDDAFYLNEEVINLMTEKNYLLYLK